MRKGPQPESREISLASILKRSRPYHASATDSARESARKERSEFVPRYKRRKVTIANPLFEEYKGTPFMSLIVYPPPHARQERSFGELEIKNTDIPQNASTPPTTPSRTKVAPP